jgi:hypothetical protein
LGGVAFVAVIVIYLVGLHFLNEAVRAACTHGNCKHGWYSKDTGAEQVLTLLWAWGFPIGLLGLWMRLHR